MFRYALFTGLFALLAFGHGDVLAATLDIDSRGLSSPANRVQLAINGPDSAAVTGARTVDLSVDGTYTVSTRGGQANYGTFTITNDTVTATSGALTYSAGATLSGSTADGTIGFDTSLLAEVTFPVGELSDPTNRSSLNVQEAAGTFFGGIATVYFPSTEPGYEFTIKDRSGRSHFGSFTIDASLQVQPVAGAGAESMWVAAGSNDFQLDRSKLAEVVLDMTNLSLPEGVISPGIPETGRGRPSRITLFLTPSRLGPYSVMDRAGFATYGVFDLGPNLEFEVITDDATKATCAGYARCEASVDAMVVTPITPALGGAVAYEVTIDRSKLVEVSLLASELSDPAGYTFMGIWEWYNRHDDVTLWLGANATDSRAYRVKVGSKIVGEILVQEDGSIELSGDLVDTGYGITADRCALNVMSFDYEAPVISTLVQHQTFYMPSGGTTTIADGTYNWKVERSINGQREWTTYSITLDSQNGHSIPALSDISLTEVSCVTDTDGDGIDDDADNCPTVANPDQIDQDVDGAGDVCDDDLDGDGIDNSFDNCPDFANANQSDLDGDGVGDVCDGDSDGDSVADDVDNCLGLANTDQSDSDQDGFGDACDPDDDNDGVDDTVDNCVFAANADQADADGDGQGDVCDGDDDNDGVADSDDLCPGTPGDAIVDANGCDGPGFIALTCGEPEQYQTHGNYVSCVAHAANDAVYFGLISQKEKARFVRAAAKSKK